MIGLNHYLSTCPRKLTAILLELKLYKQTPPNGLILFCGIILMEDGKTERKVTIDFEPFLPQV
jgi:peptide chain release factor subunit 1